MTPIRRLVVAAGGAVLLMAAALVLLPLLFGGRIEAFVRSGLDRSLDARVDWRAAGVGLFRDFPDVTLSVAGLSVVGAGPFDGDTLAAVGRLQVVLDAGSVWRAWRGAGPVVVRSVRLEAPRVHLRVLEDGSANWDVVRAAEGALSAGAGATRPIGVRLSSVAVRDGALTLEDAAAGTRVALEGLEHTLSGDLASERVVLRTHTRAERTWVRFAGAPWLAGVALELTSDVDADLAGGRFTLGASELRLNDLVVRFEGGAAREGEALDLDVTFSAPSTAFAQALSLVPALYSRDFATLQTSGSFTVEGHARGRLGGGALPGFGLRAEVVDGSFRYPDLPLPARDIALALAVDNPGGGTDSTVVRVERFHVVIGDQPVDAAFTVRTPVSDPDVDARVRGTVDLADVARTVKLADADAWAGVVSADASMRARLSDVDAERWERVAASGTVTARGVSLSSPDLRQPVSVEEAALSLTPRRADLRSFRARLGSSDVEASGWIDNLLGFVLRDEPLSGSATFRSRRFVLDEWRSPDPELEVIPVPAFLDFALEGSVDTLTLDRLTMTDARGSLDVGAQRLTLQDFGLRMLGGRVRVGGWYETLDPARPTFALSLSLDSLDVARAAETLVTVRTLAPVATYARGSFSADLDLSGALARDFMPLFEVMDGAGTLLTSRIALEGFPLLTRLSEQLRVPELGSPTLEAIRSSLEIREGRLHVRPFGVRVGDLRMGVSGSNGFDRSLDYTLTLDVPRGLLGQQAAGVVQGLASAAGRVGFDLGAADTVRLGVRVGGTVTDPSLDLGFREAGASVAAGAEQAARAAVQGRVDEAAARADSAREEALRVARARADSLVAEAERQAEAVRAEAARIAAGIRAEGERGAEEVLARATNPIARRAAEPVAARIRQEAETRAAQVETEADRRAEALVEEARRRADDLVRQAGG